MTASVINCAHLNPGIAAQKNDLNQDINMPRKMEITQEQNENTADQHPCTVILI